MPLSRTVFTEYLDGSSARLREVLGQLEGVSPETLERIDRVSRPSGDGPIPHDPNYVMAYNRLVLLALAEATAEAQKKRTAKRS
jgi:hypothetical protein